MLTKCLTPVLEEEDRRYVTSPLEQTWRSPGKRKHFMSLSNPVGPFRNATLRHHVSKCSENIRLIF